MHEQFMRHAIRLAAGNVRLGGGGPFGAVIVRGGKVIGEGVNRVTATNDPTAHAEIVAIRDACHTLRRFDLRGAVIYSSCEPCPMCLAAIYWARLDALYYAATRQDAARAGFDDEFFYRQVSLPPEARSLPCRALLSEEGEEPFRLWREWPGKTPY
jgi:tRNA(Arg) A34 adenosine deaminase TadA